MPTPTTGPLKASDINTELGNAATSTINLNNALVRALANITTANTTINFGGLRGKSRAMAVTVSNADLDITRNGYRVIGWQGARSGSLSVTGLGAGTTYNTIEYIICAGGGGGGGSTGGVDNGGGGGGAGELVSGSVIATAGWNMSISVGGGGARGNATNVKGTNGSNTTITGSLNITCRGGGGGGAGAGNRDGLAGGSGGGAAFYGNTVAAEGAATAVSPGRGFGGGSEGDGSAPGGGNNVAGGGGGAGGPGAPANGGLGFVSSIYSDGGSYEFSTGGNGTIGGSRANTYGSGGGGRFWTNNTAGFARQSTDGFPGAVIIRFPV
jgi:hypothetical protein